MVCKLRHAFIGAAALLCPSVDYRRPITDHILYCKIGHGNESSSCNKDTGRDLAPSANDAWILSFFPSSLKLMYRGASSPESLSPAAK